MRTSIFTATVALHCLTSCQWSSIGTEAVTEYELVVNMKAARAIGVAIPEAVSRRASRVVE